MSQLSHHLHRTQSQKDQALDKASPFLEGFARIGYAAKGVVYVMLGGLALLAAIGSGGETTDSRGALQTLVDQPFGQALLWIIAIGLVGYSIWQFLRAVEDPEHEGSDKSGIAKRVAFFISGVIHAGLTFFALHLLLGTGGSDDGGNRSASLSAAVMSWPGGKWLVVIVGLCIAGYGVKQVMRAWKAKISDMLNLSQLSSGGRRAAVAVSRVGMGARGVVFFVAGAFAVIAGWQTNPDDAKGIGEALAWIRGLPAGWVLLALVATGLVAYGLSMFVKARYRRIDPA